MYTRARCLAWHQVMLWGLSFCWLQSLQEHQCLPTWTLKLDLVQSSTSSSVLHSKSCQEVAGEVGQISRRSPKDPGREGYQTGSVLLECRGSVCTFIST